MAQTNTKITFTDYYLKHRKRAADKLLVHPDVGYITSGGTGNEIAALFEYIINESL